MPTVSVCVKQTGCAADKYLTLNRIWMMASSRGGGGGGRLLL